MKLNFKSDFETMFAGLEAKVKTRLPIAVAIAMTKTAQDVKLAEIDEMTAVFDRPTPYTLNSPFLSPATPAKLEAEVWLKDDFLGGGSHPATEYLIPEIEGGVRVEKRSEYILRQAGILPEGMNAVPGPAATMDAYGNMSRGQVQQILSWLRLSETVSGRTANRPLGPLDKRQARRQAKQTPYFVASKDSVHGRHLHPGIWARTSTGIHLVIAFVPRTQYHGVLDFARVADETTDRVFEDHLREEIAVTIARVA